MIKDFHAVGLIWGVFRDATGMDLPFPHRILHDSPCQRDFPGAPRKVRVYYPLRDNVDGYIRKVYVLGTWFYQTDTFEFKLTEPGFDPIREIQAQEFGILALMTTSTNTDYDPESLKKIFDGL